MESSFLVYSPRNAEGGRDGGHILLHRERSDWIRVNDTGLEIARALDEGASEDDLVGSLVSRYGIAENQARQDVRYVSAELRRAHFFDGTEPRPLRNRTPASLFFHLTMRCNLACRHCYVSCPENIEEEPNDLEADAVLRTIDELAEKGGRAVTLSGGEPLLHPEIKKILSHTAPKLGISLLTNGTLIDREWAALLADLDARVQISLDGSTAEIHDLHRGKGSFDRALRGVEHLQQAGLGDKLNFCTTPMTRNLHDLKEIIHLAESLGVPLVRFIPLRQEGSARKAWSSIGSGIDVEDHEAFYRYTNELGKKGTCSVDVSCGLSGFLLKIPEDLADDDLWCPAGRQLVVYATGDTYPCVLMMSEEYRLGNIYQDSLSNLQRSEGMARLCGALTGRRRKIEKCAACSWRNLCQAGCMGLALDQKGTLWDTDLFCDYRNGAYRKAFDQILRS